MELIKTYQYLTDNYTAFIESVTATHTYSPSHTIIALGVVLALFGIAFSIIVDFKFGSVIIFLACILVAWGLWETPTEDPAFDKEDYQAKADTFIEDLHKEMQKEHTDLPKKELIYTSFTVEERLNSSDNPTADVTINFNGDTIIRRVKVISTDNPNLVGKYRELPDEIDLGKEPFNLYQFEGYLFVKDLASIETAPEITP